MTHFVDDSIVLIFTKGEWIPSAAVLLELMENNSLLDFFVFIGFLCVRNGHASIFEISIPFLDGLFKISENSFKNLKFFGINTAVL